MASTTQTTNFGLPLYQSSDRPAWTDTNTPFETIDAALKAASDNASSAADAVAALTSALSTLNQTVSDHTTELSTLTNAVASAATAQGTSFTAHGLNTATDVQTAIQNAGTAAINSYDNTTSGLTAANVQAAIDELNNKLASNVTVELPVENLAIDTAWGSVYAGNATLDISSLQLSNAPTITGLLYEPSTGGTAYPSVVVRNSNYLEISFIRGTAATVTGNLVVTMSIN